MATATRPSSSFTLALTVKQQNEKPTSILHSYSDLKKLLRHTSWNSVENEPPSAPHMGGIREAAVKSKFHLSRVTGKSIMTFEEHATLLKEVEACLNSRPICVDPTDPDEPRTITPGHFLIGRPLKAVPEADVTTEKLHVLTRWQRQQQQKQQLWKHWHIEYLQHLQKRKKWKEPISM
ncbi:unnamed protein product [Allacma fusca]|uniref:DUF5641 domain-containing protein n=1 Tax=Allacma fusca TaxID=39272 RepID=A0A8J2L8J1_9HEXA|nr:unnamed protein product [Allacma fusca]